MCKLQSALIAAACLGLTPSTAWAQEGASTQGLSLDQARVMDADRNGRITEAEFLREFSDRALFAQLDANFDGELDSEELRQGIRVSVRTLR